jgi:hypothetical protein
MRRVSRNTHHVYAKKVRQKICLEVKDMKHCIYVGRGAHASPSVQEQHNLCGNKNDANLNPDIAAYGRL